MEIIFGRRDGAIVARNISAVWIVGFVEIKEEPVVANVTHSLIEISSTSITFDPGCVVSKRNEEVVSVFI
jgi:hypothetical protein